MKPGTFNLEIARGVRTTQRLHCLDVDGEPVPLTGYTPKVQARKTASSALAFDVPITLFDAANGILEIDFTPEASSSYPLGGFDWDLLLIKDAIAYGPFFVGKIKVKDTVTDPDE